MRSPLLAPPPHSCEPLDGEIDLRSGLACRIDPSLEPLDPALTELRSALKTLGSDLSDAASAPPGPGAVRLDVVRSSVGLGRESYRLDIGPDRLALEAADGAGAFYGLHTLRQYLDRHRQSGGTAAAVPRLRIDDRPDLAHRGVLLDISRSRVPTMASLYRLVDRLAGWKINQLQLYIEHTFAYSGHEAVWAGSSPLTPDEVRRLDEYCAARHIELVPNQNSFGHLHRWLRHPRYRPLAECPDGLEHPFGDAVEPFSLCPTDPASLAFLEELYSQLLPCFTSRRFNVGLDETFDLGRGRSAARAQEAGVARLYSDFLHGIHGLLEQNGRRMQFWGDILAKHPELVDELPDDVTVLCWGYEADHPFEDELRPIRARGLEAYVCPGTSSWLSFGGRVDNAVSNIANAIRSANRTGASGCLVTDWGDQGHLQPPPISLPGFLTTACLSWNAEVANRPSDFPLVELLDAHALDGPASGLATPLTLLGDLYRRTGAGYFNGSALFHLVVSPWLPLSHRRLDGLAATSLQGCREALSQVRSDLDRAPDCLARQELQWTTEALEAGVDIGLDRLRSGALQSSAELPADVRRGLTTRFDRLLDDHGELWTARSRPGGSAESRGVLEKARAIFSGDAPSEIGAR